MDRNGGSPNVDPLDVCAYDGSMVQWQRKGKICPLVLGHEHNNTRQFSSVDSALSLILRGGGIGGNAWLVLSDTCFVQGGLEVSEVFCLLLLQSRLF